MTRMLLMAAVGWFVLGAAACGGSGGDACQAQLVFDTSGLEVSELRLLSGRLLGRLVMRPQDAASGQALQELGRAWAAGLPRAEDAPGSDAELVALVPAAGSLGDGSWQEDLTDQIEGPWLVSTNAYDWIDGAGKPFADNGFQAAAGEAYLHLTNDWQLRLELVDQGSCAGAAAAFAESGWAEGQALE